MKKITSLFLILATAAGLYAQSADDALTIAQDRYEGTARSMAMGNAFTALGGDLGGLAINPAASGVFGCSQFTVTPTTTGTSSYVDYLGNSQKASGLGFGLSNMGLVLAFDTGRYSGLVNYNFGFVYNRKNNFRSRMVAEGTTDGSSMLSSLASGLGDVYWDGSKWNGISKESLENSAHPYSTYPADLWPSILAWNAYALAPLYLTPEEDEYMYIASTENYDDSRNVISIGGPLNQRFNRKTYGSNDEFAFNFGGNISDFLYFGANANFHRISQTVEEYYEEKAKNSNDFQDGFVSMDNSYWQRTTGAGFDIKVGVIVTPIAGLRLGATLTTPTWYKLTDQWDYTMNTAFNNGKTYTEYSPTGEYSYRLTTPMRWSVGAAYTFWDRALVSVDYEKVNYKNIRYANENGGYGTFSEQNSIIQKEFLNASILRTGAEIRLNRVVSLRGGYQYYSPSVRGGSSLRVYSAGIGFNIGDQASIDLAWNRSSLRSQVFQLYGNYDDVTAPTGTTASRMSQLACTFALKF